MHTKVCNKLVNALSHVVDSEASDSLRVTRVVLTSNRVLSLVGQTFSVRVEREKNVWL